MKTISIHVLFGLLALTLGAKAATILTFDDRTVFEASISDESIITFAGTTSGPTTYVPFGGDPVVETSASGPTASATFSASGGLYAVGATAFGEGDGSTYFIGNNTDIIAPVTAVNAVGFDIFAINGETSTPISGTVTDSLGHTLAFSATALGATGSPSLSFVGFTDSAPGASITSITFAETAGLSYDNVTLGTFTPVVSAPEPSTWAMLAGGFVVLLGAMRISKIRKA